MKEKDKPVAYGQVFRRLGRIVRLFLQSPSGPRAKWFLGALLVLILGINGLNVLNSYVGRYFMSAIESRDWSGFCWFAWLYGGVFGLQTMVGVYFRFSEERLGLHWREWLTHRIVNRYVDRRIYLLVDEAGTITNPDQRIAEDVKALTVSTLSFFLMILNGTMTTLSFSGVLWSISPQLFVVAVVYAIAGSALTIRFGKPLVRLNYQQSDREADFRSELIRARDNAEHIALTGSEHLTRERLTSRIDSLAANFRRIISVNRNLSFFTTGYNYMIQLIPTLLVAPLFMRQGVEFGIIGQSGMAFATLLGAFSLVVTQFQSISAYASVIARLGEFVDAVEKASDQSQVSRIGSEISADRFEFRDLTLLSADRSPRVLVDRLNASLLPGRCVLIAGPNDAARQALWRAAATLHDSGSGAIVRPPAETIAFLPEQPFLPGSTLGALMQNSRGTGNISDEELRLVLEEVGLGLLISKHDGLTEACAWDEILSLEERQLLAIARALLMRPAFVLSDRLESALLPQAQQRVLRLMAGRGIGLVLFSRGKQDASMHDSLLELREDGSWNWRDLR